MVQVNPKSVIPAVGLAVATLLPASTPRRRLVGATLVAGTYGSEVAAMRSGGLVYVHIDPGERLTKDQAHWATVAASGAVMGLVSVPVVGLARVLPMRRIFTAAALAGGYLALDGKVLELAEAAKAKAQVAREQAMRARDKAYEVSGRTPKSSPTWHQATTS